MTATRINTLRAAVVATISEALPALGECKEQFGRFNLEELETNSVKSPAVRVAVLKVKARSEASGTTDASLGMAAFVVVDGKDRDNRGWAIAEAIAVLLHPAQRWGVPHTAAPVNVEIQPVLTGKLKPRAVSLFAVEWSQDIRRLGSVAFDDEGHLLEELYVNDEAVDLEELGGGSGEGGGE